ncbi:MAG: PAS domain S-box protein [Bacteroidales bacterium]|jgi:PAS domain S-box-containing protein|nr:PAS domain S-box protein [Bacteroidales bacterium]
MDFSIPVFDFSNKIIGTLIFQHSISKTIKPIITRKSFQESLLKSHLFYKESNDIISYDYQNNTLKKHKTHSFPISDSTIHHLYITQQSESFNQIINDSLLTSVTTIPHTNWFLYSSLPIEIVYEKHFKTQLFISILIIILFLLFITILAFVRIQRKHRLFKKLYILEQEFKTLFYSIGDTIIVTDTNGLIQKINAGAENLIHKKEKDILEKHIDSIIQVVQEKNKISHQEIITNVLNTGKTQTMFQTSLYTSDGEIIPIYESIAPIRNENDTISGLIFLFHNQSEQRRIQKELEETNRQLESLFTNLPGMFYRCQNVRDWNMIFVSDGAYNLTGYSPDKFISNTILFGSLIHPDDREYVYSTIQENLSKRTNFRLEYRIFTKNNNTKWIWEKGTGIYDSNGNVLAIEGYIEDITEFKHTQILLKNSEEMYRKQFENHIAIQFLIEPESGKIVNINKAGEEYYGWSKEKILHKKIDEINVLSHEEFTQQVEYYQKNNIKVFESEHYRSDGSIGVVEVYSSPVEIQEKTYIHSIVHDVTMKKQAENQIILQSHAIEQSPVSIIVTNNTGNIEYVNKKFCEISKYSREEVIGQNPSILRSNAQLQEFYMNLWNTILSGKDWEGEFENKKKDGTLYWEKAIISPIKNKEGVITHFIAIKEDITEKKNLIAKLTLAKEKAEENDTLKSAFLANMSHEIRTPMNGIVGFSEFLKDPNLGFDLRKKYAHIIIESSKQLLTIVNDILDISRIESNTLYISKEAFSLNELFTETYDFFVPQISEKNIEFTLDKDLSNTESYINSDKSRIKQILTNLISNAIKFTESGSIKIGYTIKKNTIELFVHDTGIGISLKNQEIIFKSFQQVQHASKKQYGGTGLGLAISHEIAHLLGGTLTVKSTQGKGSKFTCTIPYSPTTPPHKKHIVSEPVKPYTKDIVLVAEDDDTNFLYLQTVLSFTGVEVVRAHNGEQAIQTALNNSNISLIFMDVKMPKVNGFEASKEILSHIPDLPIIILSALNLENERTLASEIGCYDYIVKPIKKDTVTKIIAEILKNQ